MGNRIAADVFFAAVGILAAVDYFGIIPGVPVASQAVPIILFCAAWFSHSAAVNLGASSNQVPAFTPQPPVNGGN